MSDNSEELTVGSIAPLWGANPKDSYDDDGKEFYPWSFFRVGLEIEVTIWRTFNADNWYWREGNAGSTQGPYRDFVAAFEAARVYVRDTHKP